MPSALGILIRSRRQSLDLGVRALARIIKRSPAFIVRIESDDPAPAIAEETLYSIGAALELESTDRLFLLANKTPPDVIPCSVEEIALFRGVKRMLAHDPDRLTGLLESLRGSQHEVA